jgi:hypothetical protein
MNNFGKLVAKMGLLSLLSVMPLAAQIGNGVLFTAPFPFHAGNVELPAGSYRLTKPTITSQTLLLQNRSGVGGVFLYFIPTSSVNPSKESNVTFDKIGNTGYLRAVSVAGDTDGIAFGRSKAEKKAAGTTTERASIVEHVTLAQGE